VIYFKVEEGTPTVASGCDLATPLVVMPSSSTKVASFAVRPYMHENAHDSILVSFLAWSLTT
jgi:hypothetical protein